MRDHGPMRVLFSTAPGVGHLLPLLPVARAARDRDHEVVIAAGTSLSAIIADAGFRHETVGPATIGEMFGGLPDVSSLPARERALVTMPRVFVERIAPAMAAGVAELVEGWRPDVVVHEDLDFGSGLVADRIGIPHVTVQATAWRPHVQAAARGQLASLREQHGLGPDEHLDRLFGQLFLSTRPVSLRDPEAPLPHPYAELRPVADDRRGGAEESAGELFPADGRPRVALTLGTVSHDQITLMRSLIDGAVAAGANVVVALGADPDSLGVVPPGVIVRAYVPMSTLLPAADAVVYHGGSGTMLAALASGTPMVIVPLAADQPDNGDRCLAAGVARVVAREEADAATIQAAVAAVLTDSAYQRRADAVAVEVAAMPGPDAAIERIESIVRALGSPGPPPTAPVPGA